MDDELRRAVSEFLRRGAWFRALAREVQDLILDRSAIRSFRKGEIVSREDDPPLGLSALLEGRLWLVRYVETDTEHLVHVAEPGFWFGELAILTGRPAAITVLARTPARTLLLPYTAFEEIATRDPRFYRATVQLALCRYGLSLRHVAEAHRFTAEGRLRLVLADRAEMRRWDYPDESPLCLALSQEELARLAGLSRQTLNGLLQELRSKGLIELSFRCIRVLDLEGLRKKS
jgi:CRP-like cAMP-binding protein